MLYDVHGEKVALADLISGERISGTIHCSALSLTGEIACTTTTSGLSFKIPGRVGDSPILGAGLYCDQEAGSAGGTGRGESASLATPSFPAVELTRQGAAPSDAWSEVLRRASRLHPKSVELKRELRILTVGKKKRKGFLKRLFGL